MHKERIYLIYLMTKASYLGKWLHGEAVAAGIVMAADLSWRLGWIESTVFERTRKLLERAELPIKPPKVVFNPIGSDILPSKACIHKHRRPCAVTVHNLANIVPNEEPFI